MRLSLYMLSKTKCLMNAFISISCYPECIDTGFDLTHIWHISNRLHILVRYDITPKFWVIWSNDTNYSANPNCPINDYTLCPFRRPFLSAFSGHISLTQSSVIKAMGQPPQLIFSWSVRSISFSASHPGSCTRNWHISYMSQRPQTARTNPNSAGFISRRALKLSWNNGFDVTVVSV